MKTGKAFLIGCGSLLAIGLIVAGLLFAFMWHASKDPEGITLGLEGPKIVSMDEEFTLTVTVRNDRKSDAVGLTDIDIDEDFLSGLLLISMDPKPKTSIHVPIDNKRSYTFGEKIPPGGVARYAFRFRSISVGVLRGDIDVCEGTQFLTLQAEVLVKEK